jgi:hypothetical protein
MQAAAGLEPDLLAGAQVRAEVRQVLELVRKHGGSRLRCRVLDNDHQRRM